MEKKLLSAYMLVGDDELKRSRTLKKLKTYVPEDMQAFNLDEYRAQSSLEAKTLIASLNTLPVMGDIRLVIIEDAQKLSKQAQDALVDYLASPCQTSVLCLVAESMRKNARIYKAIQKIDKKAIIDCASQAKRELPQQVVHIAQQMGKTISVPAAQELIARVGQSTLMLHKQIELLCSYLGSKQAIELEDVVTYIQRTAEATPWVFLDALCQKDTAKAFELYRAMPNTSPVLLLSLCTERIRELICAVSCKKRGCPQMLAQQLNKQAWQVKNHMQWIRNFSEKELIDDLRAALACEKIVKGAGDSESAFIRFFLTVAS